MKQLSFSMKIIKSVLDMTLTTFITLLRGIEPYPSKGLVPLVIFLVVEMVLQ